MNRIIKTLPAEDGTLYAVSAGQRIQFANFSGRIEIIENTALVPVLGRVERGIKQIFASFIFCGDLQYTREISSDFIHAGKVYEATADIENERLYFGGLRFEDSDPVKNELKFEITDAELIKKLLEK